MTGCFISGVAGFLGSAVATACLDRGWEVCGCDSLLGGDAANVPDGVVWTADACQNLGDYPALLHGADIVFHCAAAPYDGASVFCPQIVYEHTVMATVALLRQSIAAGVGRFVHCSSMARYGAQCAPFAETQPPAPVTPYGHAKAAAEAAVANLCGLHGMDWTVVIPHNIYGPGQRYDDPFRNVAAIMINRVLQGKPPVVYGDGSQVRSMSYIADAVDPLIAAGVAPQAAGQVFNIGPDQPDAETTMGDLARLVVKLCGADLEPEFHPARPAEVHDATCSALKARRMLGYRPSWAMEDGLREMIAWIRARGPKPFDYGMAVELPSERTPRTWTERLL